MKKYLSLILVIVLCLVLTGCGNEEEAPNNQDNATNQNSNEQKQEDIITREVFLVDYIERKNQNDNYLVFVEDMGDIDRSGTITIRGSTEAVNGVCNFEKWGLSNVCGKQGGWNSILQDYTTLPKDLFVYIDLADLGVGKHNIPFSFESENPTIEILTDTFTGNKKTIEITIKER